MLARITPLNCRMRRSARSRNGNKRWRSTDGLRKVRNRPRIHVPRFWASIRSRLGPGSPEVDAIEGRAGRQAKRKARAGFALGWQAGGAEMRSRPTITSRLRHAMDRLAAAQCHGCLDAARTRAFRPSHPSMAPESEPEFQPMAYGLAISERRNAARAGNDDDCRRNTRSGGLLDNPTETRRSPHRRSSVEP